MGQITSLDVIKLLAAVFAVILIPYATNIYFKLLVAVSGVIVVLTPMVDLYIIRVIRSLR